MGVGSDVCVCVCAIMPHIVAHIKNASTAVVPAAVGASVPERVVMTPFGGAVASHAGTHTAVRMRAIACGRRDVRRNDRRHRPGDARHRRRGAPPRGCSRVVACRRSRHHVAAVAAHRDRFERRIRVLALRNVRNTVRTCRRSAHAAHRRRLRTHRRICNDVDVIPYIIMASAIRRTQRGARQTLSSQHHRKNRKARMRADPLVYVELLFASTHRYPCISSHCRLP